MLLSNVIEKIIKGQISSSINDIIIIEMRCVMEIKISKLLGTINIDIDLNKDYIIKVGFHKGDKDPKYRHGLRVIDNNITSDLEYYLTKKLTKTKMARNEDYEDIELSDSYSYNVDKWFI